jgi:hypothetical protein
MLLGALARLWVRDSGDPPTRGTTAPKPFLWTKTAEQILAGVARVCGMTIEQATS